MRFTFTCRRPIVTDILYACYRKLSEGCHPFRQRLAHQLSGERDAITQVTSLSKWTILSLVGAGARWLVATCYRSITSRQLYACLRAVLADTMLFSISQNHQRHQVAHTHTKETSAVHRSRVFDTDEMQILLSVYALGDFSMFVCFCMLAFHHFESFYCSLIYVPCVRFNNK